jgi:hypothetical protein
MDEEAKESQLVPLKEQNNLIARVVPELSSEIYERLIRTEQDYHKENVASGAFGKPTRVSDMYISRYGIMGYSEYNMGQECLGGIILVPKKLSLVLQLVGETIWKNFKEKHFGTLKLEEQVENLKDFRHRGVKFVDEKYFWACHPHFLGVGPQMIDQIRDITESVLNFMKELDESVDEIRGYRSTGSTFDFS